MRLIDVDRLLNTVSNTSVKDGWSYTGEIKVDDLIDLINDQPIVYVLPKEDVTKALTNALEEAAKEIEHKLLYGWETDRSEE